MNDPYPELPRERVDALGIETNYYHAGTPNGRPVVLLHGMSTSADSFREIMHELSDSHWLIAPDIPGFGYSANTQPYTMPHLVEWLAAFVTALDLPPIDLIGHSFGGILAPGYTLAYPEDVRRQMLLAPAIFSADNYPDWLKKVGISLGFLDMGTALSRLFLQRQIRVPFYDASRQDESLWPRRVNDYAHARSSPAVLKASAFYDLRPHLAKIEHPTCLIWGRNDPVVNPAHSQELASLLPQAEVYLLDECGHLPMLEQPDQFLTIAREFLS